MAVRNSNAPASSYANRHSRTFYSEKALSLAPNTTIQLCAEVLACDCNVIQYSLTSCFVVLSWATRVGTGSL